MDLQPTLVGILLTLRPLDSVDFEALYAAALDPLIWEQHPKSNRHERSAFQLFFREAIDSKGTLAIIENATGNIIGCSRFYNLDLEISEVTIGATFLARQFWGGAYNRELKKLMLGHAFQDVETVEFHVGERNFRSQKALEKIGIKFSHIVETTSPTKNVINVHVFKVNRAAISTLNLAT